MLNETYAYEHGLFRVVAAAAICSFLAAIGAVSSNPSDPHSSDRIASVVLRASLEYVLYANYTRGAATQSQRALKTMLSHRISPCSWCS